MSEPYEFERLMRMQERHDAMGVAKACAGKPVTPEEMAAAMIELRVGPNAFRQCALPWRWHRYVMRKSYRRAI